MNSLINRYLEKFPEEEKLKRSIIYGWSLVGLGGILPFLIFLVFTNEGILMVGTWMWLIGVTLFAFRYSSAKPILGAAAGGIKVMGFAYIIDLFLSRRNGGGGALLGAFVGVMFVLIVIFTKNLIVGLYFLSMETYRYIHFKKNTHAPLEQTVLFEEPLTVQA